MLYGQPLCPRAISTTKATSTTAIITSAVTAVARKSMAVMRSSRRSSNPRTVSLRRRARRRPPLNATITANASTPLTGFPATERATRYTTPISTPKIGVARYLRLVLAVVCMENLLDGNAEKPGDRDGQRQRRGIAAGLDRVDRLPGHVHALGEVALRQPFRGTALPHVIPHRGAPDCQARLSCFHSAGPPCRCQTSLSSSALTAMIIWTLHAKRSVSCPFCPVRGCVSGEGLGQGAAL